MIRLWLAVHVLAFWVKRRDRLLRLYDRAKLRSTTAQDRVTKAQQGASK